MAIKIPTLQGLIDRRILVNYTVEPEVLAKLIPAPFRPQLYKGKAIAGICLIRLKQVRPKGFPAMFGIASENAAHRMAVEWDEDGAVKNGVYIPRRDTSLMLNALAGGRVFPGKHYLAKFNVKESGNLYHVDYKASDQAGISVDAEDKGIFDQHSIFENLANASAFFEQGSVGYSPSGQKFEGMKLKTLNWLVSPLTVTQARSSFFENEALFPKGSVQFDNALLMKAIEHEWHNVRDKQAC